MSSTGKQGLILCWSNYGLCGASRAGGYFFSAALVIAEHDTAVKVVAKEPASKHFAVPAADMPSAPKAEKTIDFDSAVGEDGNC